ncbi:hypothetical protein [Brevundimonas sp. NIBR10]|nr:hypothetical protein [Brevundimonas sp. NIBR10]
MRNTLLCGAALMAMAMSGQALAQDATAPSDELGEVVVTAQRRS